MWSIDRFRYRTRYFTDSGIIGTKEFVSRVSSDISHPNMKNARSLLRGCTASIPSNGSLKILDNILLTYALL